MTKQGSLFETSNHDGERSFKPSPIARRTDPATSHKAATNVDLSKHQKLFYDTLKAWGNIPRTSNEIAEKAIPIDDAKRIMSAFRRRETLRKRAGELVKLKMIVECQSRPCRVTGNDATTYEVAK